MTRFAYAFISILSLSALGCVADEPNFGNEGEVDAGIMGPDAGEEDDTVLLSVEGFSPQTYWETVPVHGKGPAGGTLLVDNNGLTVPAEIQPSGDFCVDVPLEADMNNVMTFQAVDEDGERSEIVSIEVMQSGEPPEPGDPQPSVNRLKGGLPIFDHTSMEEEEGTFSNITDDVRSTAALISNSVFSDDHITFRVPVSGGVERLRVYSDPECTPQDYYISTVPQVTSTLTVPNDFSSSNAGEWTVRGRKNFNGPSEGNMSDCSTSSLHCTEFSFSASVVSAVMLYFYDGDNRCDTFSYDQHRLHEVEAWSPEGAAPTEISPPSCGGAGN